MMPDTNPWSEALAPTGTEAAPAVPTPQPASGKVNPRNPWASAVKSIDLSDELGNHAELSDDLRNFFKFSGHGVVRGLMEVAGFPVDMFNAAGYYITNHPEAAMLAVGESGVVPEQNMEIARQAKKAVESGKSKYDPVYRGSTRSIRDAGTALGLNTQTPEEAGVHSGWAEWGDTFGEFGGANLPFVALGPEKIVAKGGEKIVTNLQRILSLEGKNTVGLDRRVAAALHDTAFGALAPGTGAAVGSELVDKENKDAGKAIGALVGGLRVSAIGAAFHYGQQGASWLHDFLGFGTGARSKVAEAMQSSLQRPTQAAGELARDVQLSPGAQIPTDIKVGDEGLIALRRQISANDAVLSGRYYEMRNATQAAIDADRRLDRGNFASSQEWLDAKQKTFEDLAQKRLMQAQQQAERDTDAALAHVQANPNDAVLAKQAYALTLRNQLFHARDDLNAVTEAKWAKVDKTVPVETHGLYDDLKTLQNEHKARPGESAARFPGDVVDRFFKEVKGADGTVTKVPKFGPGTRLQEAVDLDSEIKQQIRIESAKDAPDRVRNAYLNRISSALMRVKESAQGTEPLKDALQATRYFHETFSRGPVGEVLGLEATGAAAVTPGDTVKHFISQGPGGVDSMDALMRAMQARTGGGGSPLLPTANPQAQVREYIRQDFHDAAMVNGQFNLGNARRWMQNNAAPLTHFSDLRKELESAIQSEGGYRATKSLVEKRKDIDSIRADQVDLFMKDPGKLFNGALEARDQYAQTKKLIALTADDPTGRATEGLVQKAFDHMWETSKTPTKELVALDRLNGLRVNAWVEKNKGVIDALDSAIPGTKDRFKRIADTAKYLERFEVAPNVPEGKSGLKVKMMQATTLIARIMGANIFSDFGHRGGSIQTASIGSQAFKQLAESLTPDQATKIFRQAMVEPEFFKAITTEVTKKNEREIYRQVQPYLYSMGIPLVQPDFIESSPESRSNSKSAPVEPSVESLYGAKP